VAALAVCALAAGQLLQLACLYRLSEQQAVQGVLAAGQRCQ